MGVKRNLNLDRFKAYMQTHELISWSALEVKAGIPKNCLKSWLSGKQKKIKTEHYLKLAHNPTGTVRTLDGSV